MYKSVRGTKDILPEEVYLWQKIETLARKILANYGYQEIRTPLIEELKLFSRSLGDTSEVVNKQMFLVRRSDTDKEDEESLVLRPEGTASVVRAYLENNLDKKYDFVKFYYLGPMFRAERPQRGRLRQFHHLGVEAIGSGSFLLDVELISLAKHLLEEFGISNFKINLNSLGCKKDKNKFSLFIKESLEKKINHFCLDCQRRYQTNVLRILDCKNEACQEILKNSILLSESFLCADCYKHFQEVQDGLKSLDIEYNLVPFLVRGLDYYTRTVFEIIHPDLGSQNALGAGGRYDDLVKELGGPDKPACGFALGLERLLLVKREKTPQEKNDLIYLVALGEKAKKQSLKIMDVLRHKNFAVDTDYQEKSLKAALRKADALKVRFVIILGDLELENSTLKLKDLKNHTQREIRMEELLNNPKDFLC
jgi:histidyl-tRNA synthetase